MHIFAHEFYDRYEWTDFSYFYFVYYFTNFLLKT